MTAFTTWADLRSAVKDALADWAAGKPLVKEFSHGERTFKFSSPEELMRFYQRTYQLEALDSQGDRSTSVIYGRARRFR
ncbi:MAG: hypothetical protein WC383_10355 [Gammaproteobacteria bacterium]|jgi:hypothetical protein